MIRRAAAIAALLVLQAALLLHAARQDFVTVDEAMHIAAGVHSWRTGEFFLYRVNPPLVRLLGTLAILPSAKEPADTGVKDVPAVRPEMRYARAFADANASEYLELVFRARLAGIVWSLLGGAIVCWWATRLFGQAAGLFALALWCVEPNILAHGHLLTPDVPATVAGLAATGFFWSSLRRPSSARAAIAGLLLGVALLTKFTVLVLLVLWPLLWTIHHAASLRAALLPALRRGALVFSVSLLVLNAGYCFRGSGKPIGELAFVSRPFAGYAGNLVGPSNRFASSWIGRLPSPVPADYLLGIDVQRRDFELGLRSYMAGHWKRGGYWSYYVYALALKVPLGFLALFVWGAARSFWRRDPVAWRDKAFVLLPPAFVLVFVSSQTGFSHHLRYVLPIFPFLIVAASRLALERWRAVVVVLAAWGAWSSLAVYPHSLSYFNELGGGPENGGAHLVDSNIDWGQDILGLKRWLDENPDARPLRLAYFGAVDPRVAGVEYRLPPSSPGGNGPEPGTFAVSVNFLYGQMFSAFDAPGQPRPIGANEFQYFRFFTPVARAGYSIYIYRISPDQANAVRRRLGVPPSRPDEDEVAPEHPGDDGAMDEEVHVPALGDADRRADVEARNLGEAAGAVGADRHPGEEERSGTGVVEGEPVERIGLPQVPAVDIDVGLRVDQRAGGKARGRRALFRMGELGIDETAQVEDGKIDVR